MLDAVIQSAETHKIGLIPSLFWNGEMLPQLTGEPFRAWANPRSKTRYLMRQYTSEIIQRYGKSPAIWGWEFGNEWNNRIDIPRSRNTSEQLSLNDLQSIFSDFYSVVRKYDQKRFIESGNSIARSQAWHLSYKGNWNEDTPQQFTQMLQKENPFPFEFLSLHLYNENIDRFARMDPKSIARPIFIGEFQIPNNANGPQQFKRVLQIFRTHHVSMAAVWAYELSTPNQRPFNVTENNERSWELKLIQAANTEQ